MASFHIERRWPIALKSLLGRRRQPERPPTGWCAIAPLLAIALGPATMAFCQAAPATTGPLEAVAVGGTFSAYRLDYGERLLMGTAFYVDANYSYRYGIEAEARWLWIHQRDNVRASTYLIGPRYAFRGLGGDHKPLRPYLKLELGVAQFHYPYHYASGEYFVLAPGGGVDYRLNSRLRLRLIDVEFQRLPQFTFGELSSVGISSGFRFRLF